MLLSSLMSSALILLLASSSTRQIEGKLANLLNPAPPPPCPTNWNHYGMNCYLGIDTPLKWADAEAYCENVGGYLIYVDSEDEYNAILGLQPAPLYLTWIGLYLRNVSSFGSYWYWSVSKTYSYRHWAAGEPNNASDGRCAAWRSLNSAAGGSDGYRVLDCAQAQPFICKQEDNTCKPFNTTANIGTIESKNFPSDYDNNLDCLYYLWASNSNMSIYIQFEAFSVETSFDIVYLYDGPSTSSPLIADSKSNASLFSGKGDFQSTGNVLTVLFHTDSSITYPGWQAVWRALPIPTPLYYSGSGGELSSPNYPNNYPSYQNQLYYISTIAPFRINLTFDRFYTESKYDVVSVYDGPTPQSKLIARISGSLNDVTPFSNVSSSNALTIRFTSDSLFNYQGWHAVWSIFTSS